MNRLKDSEGLDRRACYKRVFTGMASPEDCEAVLDDLLYVSGWTKELAGGVSYDVGVYIARELGFYDPANRQTMVKMIASLDSMSYHAKKKVVSVGGAESETQKGDQP